MTESHRPYHGLAGKCVLVTGASSGIGKATALELSRQETRLILVGRNRDRLLETFERLRGKEHEMLLMDLADLAGIHEQILDVAKKAGPIYGMCHAAGVVDTRPLSTNKVEYVQRMLTVNTLAGLELARAIARRDVMEKEGGSIVFISSVYGNIGVAGQIGYSASKGAIAAAVRSMAVELSRRKVRANSISPGLVSTAMTDEAFSRLSKEQVDAIVAKHPLGVGTPEDVARAVLFLLAPSNSWITGIDLVVDGGYSAQ